MNITDATVTVDRDVARKALRDYRAAVKARRHAELKTLDAATAKAYWHASRGRSLLRMTAALDAGGRDNLGRPRLALARADLREVHVQAWPTGLVRFSAPTSSWRDGATVRRFNLTPKTSWTGGSVTATATVPTIPPALRPAGALSRYWLLFEAVWFKAPDPDPVLLTHCGGDLYAVLATWELTAVELAVLDGQR